MSQPLDNFSFFHGDDLWFAMNSGVMPYSCFLILILSAIIWDWMEDRPISERFLTILGIFFIILVLMMSSSLNIMADADMILRRTQTFWKGVNLVFVFVSYGFVTRSLTQHRFPNLWRVSSLMAVVFVIVVYLMRVYF